jgi:hypothetical protein
VTVLVPAVILTAAVALLNLVLTFGLIRRMRMGIDTTPQRSLPMPTIGQPVGEFSAVSIDDLRVDEQSVSVEETLVAFLSPTCEPCQRLTEQMLRRPPAEEFYFFMTGEDSAAREAAGALRELGTVCVISDDSGVRQAFGVGAFPTVIRVVDGVVVSAGVTLDEVARAKSSRRDLQPIKS